MASIEPRENGKYRIRVSSGTDENGKRLFESMYYTPESTSPTKVKKELEKVAFEFEERVKNGLYLSGEKILFRDYVSIWREQWAVDNLTQSGLESYINGLNNKIIPFIGNMPIGLIRPTHIQNIVTTMKNEGKAPKTIRRILTIVNSVFKFAYDMEIVKDNPCDRVRCPKNPSKEDLHYFTPEQINAFFDALTLSYPYITHGHKSKSPKTGEPFNVKDYKQYTTIPFQWRVYFDLAIFGAFRRGELIALKWSDINWNDKTIAIKRATAKIKGGQIDKTPKTKSGIRTITLPQSSMDLLHEWNKQQKELSFKLGTLWTGKRGREFEQNYVFICLDSGEQMNVDTPTHKFGEIIDLYNKHCDNEEKKLPRIRLHDLRHSSATLMLSNGVDISTVSHRLGHAHTSVTLDVYAHWMKNNDEIASDTLEKVLRRNA